MHINRSLVNGCRIVIPHAAEQLLTAVNPARCLCHLLQELEFNHAKLHRLPAYRRLELQLIHGERATLKDTLLRVSPDASRSAAKHRAKPRHELTGRERLHDIVIRPGFEAAYPILFRSARSEEYHRNFGIVL